MSSSEQPTHASSLPPTTDDAADLLLSRGRTDQAIALLERAVEADPSARNLARLGSLLIRTPTRIEEGEQLLERAVAAGDESWERLYQLGTHLLQRRKLEAAAGWLSRALEKATGGAVGGTSFELGNALRFLGRNHEAVAAYERSATLFMQELERCPDSMAVAIWLVRILFALGNGERGMELFTDACAGRTADTFRYDDHYLPQTPARLKRLKTLIAGRDVAVLLHGPSLRKFHARAAEFAKFDLCFVGLSRFGPLETEILAPLGRRFSIVAGTNAEVVAAPPYREFLARAEPNLLITCSAAVAPLVAAGVDLSRVDERLLYFKAGGRIPPTPDDPLHFMPGNTLSVLLPLLLLGEPRRIFLFGADGGVPVPSPESHYLSDHPAFGWKMTERDRASGARNLHVDALEFDDTYALQSSCLLALYGVPRAPVLNGSPHSHYASLPKMSLDECLALLANSPRS